MRPTEILMDEHQIILQVIGAAEREVRALVAGSAFDAAKVGKIIDFIRNFADRCHHAKEEGQLFKMLERKGMPVGSGPIAVMLQEHDMGRDYVRAVAEILAKGKTIGLQEVSVISENLSAYADLLRGHIGKEDNVLYPMADRMFSTADQHELAEAFQRVEAEEIGANVHEKYHRLAMELAAA